MIKHLSILGFLLFFLGACSYTMKIQDGAMAVDRKQYAVAIKMLKKEYGKADTRIEKGKLAYLMGQSYDALHQGADAISWYKIAYDNQYGVDALRDYAFALKQGEAYTEAAQAFKELGLEIGSPYEYRKEIRACEVAAEWALEKRQAYAIEVLPFNAAAADYAPTLYGEDELVITSDRSAATGDDTYNWTGQSFSDLFVVNLTSNTVTPFPAGINTDDNEGSVAFSPDGRRILFTRCTAPKGEDAYCKLMLSTKIADGTWGPSEPLPFQKAGINYMHPAMSADGKTLYFSADDPEGWGGFDLYSSDYNNGTWEEPRLLSRTINTPNDEQFPFLDNDTLYFASSGHTGMGGLDVFRSNKLPSGNWAPPLNLKAPINSGSDDFGFIIDRRAAITRDNTLPMGYFTTRRGEVGSDDIYRFYQVVLPPEPIPTIPPEYRNLLDVYVVEKIYQEPGNPNSKVLGRRPLPGASLTIQVGQEERTVVVDEEGKVSLTLQDNTLYDFFASQTGYLNNDAKFSSIGLGKDPNRPEQVYELEIVLDKIFLNQEIVLENIYYDFDKFFIRDDAKPTLTALASILKKNPSINIQMGSHTDCRGGDTYNQELSQKRAQAAVDFLIQDGINAARLAAIGYGESQPEATCLCTRCTEEEHQRNRRTTFKIVE
jgi:peptidoglycan-associated lipoprotein